MSCERCNQYGHVDCVLSRSFSSLTASPICFSVFGLIAWSYECQIFINMQARNKKVHNEGLHGYCICCDDDDLNPFGNV